MKAPLRISAVLLPMLGCILAGSAGCTYLTHRGQDALDMVDLGVTITEKPCVGLYANCLDIFPLGYSNVDGRFVGWGGGQMGATRHRNRCWGFAYGYQEVGWGEFDPEDPSTIHRHYAGLLGMVFGPPQHDPGYAPACVHFLPHLGYVGLVWNLRYQEVLDFLLGWTTFDLAGDDGVSVGHWFWNAPE